MRKSFNVVLAVLLVLGAFNGFAAPAGKGRGSAVVETFDFGPGLGQVNRNAMADGARNFARGYVAARGAAGSEDFATRMSQRDELGQVHVRVNQSIAGLPVVGAELIVHIDDASGVVRGINGRFAADRGLPRASRVGAGAAIENAVAELGIADYQIVDAPVLTYIATMNDVVHLAWSNVVEYVDQDGEEQRDRLFADAISGELVERHPLYHRAKYRKTYTCNNGTTLPGTLLFNEGGSSSDTTAMAAYNNAGTTYDYYKLKHNRDSYNNAGATLHSSVHYSTNYNNAFWNGSQMVYGDGDGSQFIALVSLDIAAHELTHAVTDYTADLIYQNESGALNEGMSDIFGAATEIYKDGGINADTWKIGDEIYTPGTAGDALRYMNDPVAGGDYDYYPTRYIGTSDSGGVHWNSGIANLAFKLLVTGGTHPRSKTTTSVTSIGIAAAEKIFYRALDVYSTSSTNFRVMRDYTLRAASDLYGSTSTSYAQTGNAWTAVGNDWTRYSTSITTSNGNAYTAQFSTTTTGYLTGQFFGPAGTDFDVYLQKWNGSSWAQVASGATASANETVQYNGTAGTYRWRIHAYSGTGTYNLYSNRPR